MATKNTYRCSNCRRMLKENITICPYCGTKKKESQATDTSAHTQQNSSVDDIPMSESTVLASPTPIKRRVTTIESIPTPKSQDDNIEEALFNAALDEDDSMEEADLIETSDMEPQISNPTSGPETEPDNEGTEADDEFIVPANNASISQTKPKKTNEPKQEKVITWNDEKNKARKEKTPAYDENGIYNPNHDGYYDDILPRINDEVDRILINRQKSVLKVVAGIVAIFAIIAYLILTL